MTTVMYYRSEDGKHRFSFQFVRNGDYFDIFCLSRPSLNGQDPNPMYTHLFDHGRICFVAGREPSDINRAQTLAAQWAEYFVRYRRTGRVEN